MFVSLNNSKKGHYLWGHSQAGVAGKGSMGMGGTLKFFPGGDGVSRRDGEAQAENVEGCLLHH